MAALGASNQISLFQFNPSSRMQEDVSHQERGDPACSRIAFYFVQSVQGKRSGQDCSPQPAWDVQSPAPAPAQLGGGCCSPIHGMCCHFSRKITLIRHLPSVSAPCSYSCAKLGQRGEGRVEWSQHSQRFVWCRRTFVSAATRSVMLA